MNSFHRAALEVKELKRRPSNPELLLLYGYFKQGTVGDVVGKRPGRFAMKKRAKFDAWAANSGMLMSQAQNKYVELVQQLKQKYG